jgi:hypothetical protein
MGVSVVPRNRVKLWMKSEDEVKNNTNEFALDDYLYDYLEAGRYEIIWRINVMVGNVAGGIKWYIGKAASITLNRWGGIAPGAVVTPNNNANETINLQGNTSAWQESCFPEAEPNNGVWITVHTIADITGAGTHQIGLMWAQEVAHASDLTVKAGSYMRIEKIS